MVRGVQLAFLSWRAGGQLLAFIIGTDSEHGEDVAAKRARGGHESFK